MIDPLLQFNSQTMRRFISIEQVQAWQRNQAKRLSSGRTINFSRRLFAVKVPVSDAGNEMGYRLPISSVGPLRLFDGKNSMDSVSVLDVIYSGRTKTPLTSRTGLEPSSLGVLKPYGSCKRMYVRILLWITKLLIRNLNRVYPPADSRN